MSVDDDDKALFRDEVGDVRPVPVKQRVDVRKPVPREPRMSKADDAEVMEELLEEMGEWLETGDELSYLRPGYQMRLLKRLKRGAYSVRGELDLHQMRAKDATDAIRQFLAEAQREEAYCLRIVHGKGRRSGADRGPVLKNLVNGYLRRRKDVIAFASAPPREGGTGAVHLLLRRKY